MSPLNAFTTTWTATRATFGDGTPVDGSQLDGSAVRAGQEVAQSAKPTDEWSGTGAGAYSAANSTHVSQLGAFAEIDRRFGVEIGHSAEVVNTGRRDLATVRKWVADAAATVPDSTAGQQMLWWIVGKGVGDMQTIVTRSNAEQSTIAERVRDIGREYDQVSRGLGTDAPQSPPDVTDEDTRTHDEKVAEWSVKVEMWHKKVADLTATRPPDNTTDIAAAEAWNARRRELMKEGAELFQESVELGIEMPTLPGQSETTPSAWTPRVPPAARIAQL